MVAAPEMNGTTRGAGARVSRRRERLDEFDGVEEVNPRGGLRLRLRGGVPESVVGRVAGGIVVAGLLGGLLAGLYVAQRSLLKNERFVIGSSAAIQILGNSHLTRPQLLSVFGEDVDRNILTVPLAERRAELERLPWVEHATVMRLLPDKLRVAIVERTPVAFVRQGGRIGLVDGTGVLLDLAVNAAEDGAGTGGLEHYSFPVVTGLSAEDAPTTRKARMKLYGEFTRELDGGGKRLSDTLSEVDLSNPEDVKAMIPAGSGTILVHFGEDHFLERYERFEANLPKWKTEYPRLASADMRYERQVVLDMQPGAAVPVAEAGAVAPPTAAAPVVKAAAVPVKAAAAPVRAKVVAKKVAAKPVVKAHAKVVGR